VGQGAAPGAGADDDDVIMLGHGASLGVTGQL
jgi:hypothetical protein